MQIILMTSDTVATLNQSHTVITALIVFKGYDTDAFFYSVCMICWNKSYIDQCLLGRVVVSVTWRTDMNANSCFRATHFLFRVNCFSSLFMCLYLGKDRYVSRVLCHKRWPRLILWVFGNWENTSPSFTYHFKVCSCCRNDTSAVSGSWKDLKAI